jgi:hypothetical protein
VLLPSALRPSAIWRAFGTTSVTSSMRKPGGRRSLSRAMAARAGLAMPTTMASASSA